jgi:DNA-binding transcriptional LysR family regulator
VQGEFDNLKIRKLDGGLLLIFRELLTRRQANAVAQQLGLSPSAISHALRRLRELFDDPLFVRRSHGLEPTRRAIDLGPRIEALLQAMGQTVSGETGFDPGATRRRFRMAAAESLASVIGPGLVEAVGREAPLATFSIRYAVLERALRAVRRGEVDLALGVFPVIPPAFAAVPLFEDEYCVIARQGHPMVVEGRIDRGVYAAAGHIFVGSPDGALADEVTIDRGAIDATYGKLPGPHDIATHGYVDLWETAMLIVATTDAMADCPRSLAEQYAERLGLQVLDPPFRPFRFSIKAVRLAQVRDPGLDWFVEKLAAAAGPGVS